jgi:hypothetical protein
MEVMLPQEFVNHRSEHIYDGLETIAALIKNLFHFKPGTMVCQFAEINLNIKHGPLVNPFLAF